MKSLLFSLIVFSNLSVAAQFMEFGGGVGMMNYSGDMVKGLNLTTSTPAATAFYRMNLSEIFTVRLGLTMGSLKGSEVPIDAFAAERGSSFNVSLRELSGVFEYHFFDFKTSDSPFNFSPYLMGGVALFAYNAPTDEAVGRYQLSFPMGVGFKYLFNKKFTIGIEGGARKTFFDYLDGISDGDQTIKDYQYGNPKDKDWYFYSGLTFSITLFDIPCPFPYTPNRSILAR